ncbi:carbohydrate ABC transporter permease [Paenibacillus roseipurpureus]|uniref:Carbohydrate ABC transporter permease n=1 Tax=Paenibacillus roseopurpureus TaxID=2918901 RepID=A0AA96LTU1_9BACL|nr:carbohydrate ABC transporter permease [Paenibacillus sp. MBLB1832]WNR45954.1 carbohydrate ABC transporter permease [Paenibacillus sp. MBLB1832]
MRVHKSFAEQLFNIGNIAVMCLVCMTIIYPFWQQVVLSFSRPEDAQLIGLHLYTTHPTLDSFRRIFMGSTIYKAYYWTIVRTVLGTILTVGVTTMMAYPLAKVYLLGRKFWMWIVVFTMFFSGGLVPTYLLVKNLHLTNTIWSLVLPGLVSAWNIIIIRNFYYSIPDELEESARMDGAHDMYIFVRIIFPLSAPVIATVTLWTLVGNWNAWFDALMYITNNKIKVLQIVLREVLNDANQMSGANPSDVAELAGQQYTPESIKAAILMVVILPIVCVYPFLQKYFVKGIMVGAVKG